MALRRTETKVWNASALRLVRIAIDGDLRIWRDFTSQTALPRNSQRRPRGLS
jgi:hypothetical protein